MIGLVLCVTFHMLCYSCVTDPKSIMQRILTELEHINKAAMNKDEGKETVSSQSVHSSAFHDIYVSVQNEMEKATSNGKFVFIIIDGLNRVTASAKTAKVGIYKSLYLPELLFFFLEPLVHIENLCSMGLTWQGILWPATNLSSFFKNHIMCWKC